MLIGFPRRLVRVVVGHGTAAADSQDTVGAQSPSGVFTAGTGGDCTHRNLSDNVSDTKSLSISLSIGVLSDGERHIVTGIKEDIGSNVRHIVWNVETCNLGVGLEDILTHARKSTVLTDIDLSELGAVVEGIAVDSGDGIGDGNGGETAVAECAPTDAVKFRAFLKVYTIKPIALEEAELANVGDVLADDKLTNLGAMLTNRCNTAVFVVVYGTGAAYCHGAIAVENVACGLSAESCIDKIRSRTAHEATVFKLALFAGELISTLKDQTVLIKGVNSLGKNQSASNGGTADEVAVSAGLGVLCPAGEGAFLGTHLVSADLAGDYVGFAVIHIGMLIVFAERNSALGVLIKHSNAAVGGYVVCGDGCLIAVCVKVNENTAEINCCCFKIEVRVINYCVGLAAGGAADIIDGTVFIDLTVNHGSGTGIAVVVAGKVEVDACCVTGCGQILYISLAAAGGVSVVGGNVSHKNLPCAAALGRIFHEPISKLLKRILIGGVVKYRNIDVTALHGVPCGRDAEYGSGGYAAVAVVIRLVVTDNVKHIHVADTIHREQGQGILPLVIIANVVNCVAKLNTEGVTLQAICNSSQTVQCFFFLNISQHIEVRCSGGRNGEAAYIRPDRAVTDAVIVGRTCGQTAQRYCVDTVYLLTRGVGDEAAAAVYPLRAGHIGRGGNLKHRCGCAVAGVCHPCDCLAVSALREVINDVIRSTRLVADRVIAVERYLEGAVAVLVSSSQIGVALCCGEARDIYLAIFIGHAQKLIVSIYADADSWLIVRNYGHLCHTGASDYGGICLNTIHGLNGIVAYRSGKAGNILVNNGNVHSVCLCAAIVALGYAYIYATAFHNRGGNVNGHGSKLVSIKYRMIYLAYIHYNGSLGSVVAVAAGDTLGEGRSGRVTASERNGRGQGGDAGKVISAQRQLPRLTYGRRADDIKLNARKLGLRCLYCEEARFTSDIAVAILQIEGDGVQTGTKVHERGGAAQSITVICTTVGTVKIEVSRLYAGSIGVGLFAVIIFNEEAEVCGIQDCSVLKLGLSTIVVHELNGGDDRRGNVLIVGAVHNAKVIKENIALQIALIQLDALSCIPADTSGGDHRSKQHTTVDTYQRAGILRHVCLQILPADLESFACAGAAAAEVDICIGPACAAISAGGNLGTKPGNGDALGNIDPYAKRRGRTVNCQVVAQAEACTVSAGQSGPVILQLNGIVAEADDIGKLLVGIGDNRALDYTAATAVVICSYGIGCHTVKVLHSGANGRIIPGVSVAAVNYHRRLHTDIYGNGGLQITANGSDGGAAGVFNVGCCSKKVIREGTGSLIGNAPSDVSVLQIDAFGLIGGLKAKIAYVVVVEVDVSGGKGKYLRILNMYLGRADGFGAADHVHRHVTGLAGGGEGSACAASIHSSVAYCAHALVTEAKADILRQSLGRSTGGVHSLGSQSDGGLGGEVFIIGTDSSVVKLAGGCHGGYNENGTRYDTLTAACRDITHAKIFFALALRDIG